jgi:hypothetical protein
MDQCRGMAYLCLQAAGRQDIFAGELGVVTLVNLAHPVDHAQIRKPNQGKVLCAC